ncbi:MAG: glycosyltransferase family 2 protein [Candidatus Marinimicrobia bacterium]|nr:glycosyltransferase family 2 protein [Candidatus Neomarinimicrobiota bacterium]MCF7850068.1 glycosyltransferase family 2 protein [Candidatus Neomarinimicrobiota bacterium]MCF7904728.1 glycosyltransferase family 2 protein [Candidatus Neomarinimicrobiota bacterium]
MEVLPLMKSYVDASLIMCAEGVPILNILMISGDKDHGVTNFQKSFPESQIDTIDPDDLTATTFSEKIQNSEGDSVLLVDGRANKVEFKQSARDLYELVAEVSSDWSMIYADYEVDDNGTRHDEHLLDHHLGRVRDNTDYGKVWLINLEKARQVLPLDETTKQHFFYELRLRLSEVGELVHIANRYAGSPYKVYSAKDGQNVFDYLMASKDSQLECEAIVSSHLKRINAYLAPGEFYSAVPYADKDYELTASVIIPVNNRPEFIGDAIESVLSQTVKDVEVIVVVNGGEADPTVPAVQKYLPGGELYEADKPEVQLIILDINNIGLCINSGLKKARGKFYVQLDSDDQLTVGAVEAIAKVFEADQKIGMVIGSYEVYEKDEKTGEIHRMESIPVVTHDEWTEENGRNNLLRINGAGAPRSFYVELARDLGYLDMNTTPFARNYGEDYEFVSRMSEHHRIGRVWDPVYKVIRHGGGTDHNIDQVTVDRNNNAKDEMRREAIIRRQIMNEVSHG